jgi:hypothetical protein
MFTIYTKIHPLCPLFPWGNTKIEQHAVSLTVLLNISLMARWKAEDVGTLTIDSIYYCRHLSVDSECSK